MEKSLQQQKQLTQQIKPFLDTPSCVVLDLTV